MKTTYILLERGTEDIVLKDEIRNVMFELYGSASRQIWVMRYPMLAELEYRLRAELEATSDAD